MFSQTYGKFSLPLNSRATLILPPHLHMIKGKKRTGEGSTASYCNNACLQTPEPVRAEGVDKDRDELH